MPNVEPTKVPPLRIRALTLSGARSSYVVDFTQDQHDTTRQLSLITGEISTGKTTVLEFIDYCLGAKSHPEHDEVMDNVRSAQLAVEVREHVPESDARPAGWVGTRYVIERPVGGGSKRAWLYRGDESGMDGEPLQSFSLDPAESDSLSQFLLQVSGLGGVRLKDAPTQEESDTSVLSFRDVQPLWYLTNRRMDNADLVLEKNPYRSLKLRQVVDYFFGVNDEQTSILAQQIDELRTELREARTTVAGLRQFLSDAGFGDLEGIESQSDQLRIELVDARQQLGAIDSQLESSTHFAAEAREAFHLAAGRARSIEGKLRERETLLRRLDPLRAQYADDIRKVELLKEAQLLFDPLSVNTCPACQSRIASPSLLDGVCSLCHSHLDVESDPALTEDDAFLAKEHTNLTRRLNQLKQFMGEVRAEFDGARNELDEAQVSLQRAQRELDGATSTTIAPFISQRDALAARVSNAKAALDSLRKSRGMLLQLRQRENQVVQTEASLRAAIERQRALEQTQQPRDVVLARISTRFESILREFGYPKLRDVRIQKNLVPVVRNHRYDQVGSSGAMTLIALAWQLAIFELSVEQGEGHPGFLLIDSPQKNLKPVTGIAPPAVLDSAATDGDAADADLHARSTSIVESIYGHIQTWLTSHPQAQIIVVDNEPPAQVIDDVVVRYSARRDEPPYGLISDADGTEKAPTARDRNMT